ncbi:MAG: hypothetical protein RI884_2231 [Pseudomonadota bacterium]|jgi:type III secretion protein W
MNLRFDTSLPPQSPERPARLYLTPAPDGQLRGTPVRLIEAPSPLGDAAEEVSLHLAEKVQHKTHSDRKIRASSLLQRLSFDQIRLYLEKVGRMEVARDLPGRALGLLSEAGQDPDMALQRLGKAIEDHTERYLLLHYARDTAVAQGASPDLIAQLEAALDDLQTRYADTLTTQLATIEHAANFGHDAQGVRHFQHALQAILGKPTLSLALREVINISGATGNRLEAAIAALQKALGTCLQISVNSQEKALLQVLVTDLYHLKALKTLFKECKALVYRLHPVLHDAH